MKSMLSPSGKLEIHLAPPTAPIHTHSKKMVAMLNRELTKIQRNLSGIREMNRMPGALVVVDPKREHIAVKEAKRMGVPTVGLIDTDSDPDTVDLPIPGNDDSIRSIELILSLLANSVLEGKAALPAEDRGREGGRDGGRDGGGREGGGRGRGNREPQPAPQAPVSQEAPPTDAPASGPLEG
jgi:small subunit ribosomal protein S2